MSRSTKIMAAFGVLGALGLAALPLASYAEQTYTSTTDITVTIEGSTSIALDNSELEGEIPNNTEGEIGDVDVTVATNAADGFRLYIKGSGNGADPTKLYSGSNYISAGTPTSGSSLWGYKGGNKAAQNAFVGVTSSDVLVLDANGPTPASGTTENFIFESSISSSQPAGTYTGQVTWTVVVNE